MQITMELAPTEFYKYDLYKRLFTIDTRKHVTFHSKTNER